MKSDVVLYRNSPTLHAKTKTSTVGRTGQAPRVSRKGSFHTRCPDRKPAVHHTEMTTDVGARLI